MKQKTRVVILLSLVMVLFACLCTLMSSHIDKSVRADTSDEYPGLAFMLINNGEEYNVKAANKQITQAAIPATYNGKSVTEIADNGFLSCTKLERVIVPTSVKRVGNNAFMRCTSLKEVSGMGNVTTYGVAAFSMCSNLEYLIMPSCVSSLGSGMLNNVSCTIYSRTTEEELATLGTSWLTSFGGEVVCGNGLVYNPYEINGEEGLTLVSYQNINVEDDTLVIPSFVDFDSKGEEVNAKVINISQFALADCEVGQIVVKHPDDGNFNHSINLNAYAFYGVNAHSIRIETDVTLEDDVYLTSEGLFSYSTIESVTLPNSITEFPRFMFNECTQLSQIKNIDPSVETNHISDKVTVIEALAFGNCYSIDKLFIEDTISYIGENAFAYWGCKPNPSDDYMQYIAIDILEEDADWPLWDNEVNFEYCEIDFTAASEFTITFVADQEGVHNVTGNDIIIVSRGKSLSETGSVPVPTSTSHDFTDTWYTSENRKTGDEFDFNKPIKRNYTLYAGWKVKEYNITFSESDIVKIYEKNTNNLLNGKTITYTYGWQIDLDVNVGIGYDIISANYGAKAIEPNEDGTYTINALSDGDVYFETEVHKYEIKYNNIRGGTYGANNKGYYTINDLPLQLDNPIWEAGYRYGIWDVPLVTKNNLRDIEVDAIWSGPVEYTITYEYLRGGTKGANNKDTYTVDDFVLVDEVYTLVLDNPMWPQAYGTGVWGLNPDINDFQLGNTTATAIWSEPVSYTITYENLQGGTKGANNKDTYTADDFILVGEVYALVLDNPTWAGVYRSAIWELNPEINDYTLNNTIATAIWKEAVQYSITYVNLRGGTKGANNKDTFTFEDLTLVNGTYTLVLDDPTWPGAYSYGKWILNPVINGYQLFDIIATAEWAGLIPHIITYKNLRGGTKGANNKETYTAEDLTPVNDKYALILDNPTWPQAYASGRWVFETEINYSNLSDIIIKAIWENPFTFNINYKNIRGGAYGANNKSTFTADDFILVNGIYTLVLDAPTWAVAYRSSAWELSHIINDFCIQNTTATAEWSNPVPYHITYVGLEGATKGANNRDTYTADDFKLVNGIYTLVLDNPRWAGVYEYCTWDLSAVINDYHLEDLTAKFSGNNLTPHYISYDCSDATYFYDLKELEYGYSEAPRLTSNINDTEFDYFKEVIFRYVPGKPGYIGEWLINGNVADRVPINTKGDVYVSVRWKPIQYTVYLYHVDEEQCDFIYHSSSSEIWPTTGYIVTYNQSFKLYTQEIEGYYFHQWVVNYCTSQYADEIHERDYNPLEVYNLRDFAGTYVWVAALYLPNPSCVAEGTMITLEDGSQKAVEDLTGDEMLLVWNLYTGSFDVAPILFIDSEPAQMTEVIKLKFSDGTEVNVISEHGFWDFNLNKYVYLGRDAAQYKGHWFNKQIIFEDGQFSWIKVQLTDVDIIQELTTAWSPVTYSHMCYYVNGMLSMPGGISGLFNIFDVDSETLKFDESAMQADIEAYGLFTYEEFSEILSVSETIFEAFNGQYLKVAIGKGLIGFETLTYLVERYQKFF